MFEISLLTCFQKSLSPNRNDVNSVHLIGSNKFVLWSLVYKGGKRGGAWERCSQKEMNRTSLVRRIWAKFTALVANFIKMAIYRTFAVAPRKNRFFFLPLICNIIVLVKYISIPKEHILKCTKIPSAEGYKNNELLYIPFS